MVCLISLASGLYKYVRNLIPDHETLDQQTEKDVFGLFYSVLAHSLRANLGFIALISNRINHPEFNNFLQRPSDRVPRKSESKEVGRIWSLFHTLIFLQKRKGVTNIYYFLYISFSTEVRTRSDQCHMRNLAEII